MVLRKADNSLVHPADRLPQAVGEGLRVAGAAPDAGEPPAPAPAPRARAAAPALRPVPSTPAGPAPGERSERRGGGVPLAQAREAAAAASNAARTVEVSNRGKQDAVFRWPVTDAEVVSRAFKENGRRYRDWHREHTNPSGVFRLSLSPFTATALARALDHTQDWIGSVRNDGRKERVPGGMRQVGLVWPVPLCDRLHTVWEDLDVELTRDGFALTKANLAIAGILFEVARVGEWLTEVPNDDRFSEPTEFDGRLGRREV